MRMSELVGTRFKERPAEAALDAHAFLLRGGYARDLGHGEWALLPAGQRVMEHLETIARATLSMVGVQPVRLPCPPEAPAEHRWRMATQLCAGETRSYTQLPLALSHACDVFRAGSSIRGGLLQSRLFRILEAYAFTLDAHDESLRKAALRSLVDCGLEDAVCAQDGTGAEVFFVPCAGGDLTVLQCPACGCAATQDWAHTKSAEFRESPLPLERVHTPGTKSIADLAAFLGIEARQTAKAVLCESGQEGRLLLALVRGDLDVSESKLSALAGGPLLPASEASIRAAGAEPGFASVLGLDRSRLQIVVDPSIRAASNLVTGANEADFHIRNFNLDRDAPDLEIADIALAVPGASCGCGRGILEALTGYEVGRLLALPENSVADWTVDGPDNLPRTPMLRILRMGLGRMMAVIMERHHDTYGPIWPTPIAPWGVQVLALSGAGVKEAAEGLYAALSGAGFDVLIDDRGLRPGAQFAEADLLGVPWRVIVGEKTLAQGHVELKRRAARDSELIPCGDLVSVLRGRCFP